MRNENVLVVAGTRPEIIKQAPVYLAMRKNTHDVSVRWVSTGQHLELEQTTLKQLGIDPDFSLHAGKPKASLTDICRNVMMGMESLINNVTPRMIVVQGDTASTFASALAGFNANIPVCHVEAGLRSFDLHNPYPEEAYRRMIDNMTTIFCAPTELAAKNLWDEKHDPDGIIVTGNTVVDALELLGKDEATAQSSPLLQDKGNKRLIFVTMHRRESWGTGIEKMCLALLDILERFDDVEVLFSVHVNPAVQEVVHRVLDGVSRVTLLEPMSFSECQDVMKHAYLIMTDSGGIQEEAPSYGVPVLVLRKVTERPEAVLQGSAIITGTDRKTIVDTASRILANSALRDEMSHRNNPYGDGKAGERIALAINRFLDGNTILLDKDEQFSG